MKPSDLCLLELKQNEIHVLFAFPDEIQNDHLISAYHNLMNENEKAQQKRFHFEKHRHQYLITRALIRSALSNYTGIDPKLIEFSKNDHGKPEIVNCLNSTDLRFNISHTDGLIACVFVLKHDIGVDVENLSRKAPLECVNRFFSPFEARDINLLPDHKKSERFFDYWTLKESYIKARGMGLSIPLEQFCFNISDNESIKISFDSRLQDNPEKWQFWLFQPTLKHKTAIALCSDKKERYRLVIKKVVPLS